MDDKPSCENIIRLTESVCPKCIKVIQARVVEETGKVYLKKECPEHGGFSVFLSNHPSYWRDLSTFYFPLMPKNRRQRDYIIRLTDRCNMTCGICLASANERPVPDMPLSRLQDFLRQRKRNKVDLMGAEPTMREDLAEIVRAVEASGNIASLHTNGIKLADFDYLRELKVAGLREVHLQFDTFDDDSYRRIRGMPMNAIKRRVLDNLRRLNVATDLKATIVRGDNEKDMIAILKFAAQPENTFIKEVFYLGCRFLGRATELSYDRCLMPDEVIDSFVEQMQGRISRDDIRRFQKLYFALLHFFGVKKCFYVQHYMVIRAGKGEVIPINEILDLAKVEAKLERYQGMARFHPWLARLYLPLALAPFALRPRFVGMLRESLILKLLLFFGFDLSKIPSRTILLGFITACDPMIMDLELAANCGKGEISMDLGVQDTGAWANISREKFFIDKPHTADSGTPRQSAAGMPGEASSGAC